MGNRIRRSAALLLVAVLLLAGLAVGASAAEAETAFAEAASAEREIGFRLPGLLFPSGKQLDAKSGERRLIASGATFGVRLSADGVLVVGMSEREEERAAYRAGVRRGDVIVEIDKTPLRHAEELTAILSKSDGKPLCLTIRRGSDMLSLNVTPHRRESGEYLLGILVRDSAAGIGTVTFIDPETGAFGGLGHGICDGESGTLIPSRRGAAVRVLLDGIERGRAGEPGELRGSLCPDRLGTVVSNTDCGVFGYFKDRGNIADAIPLAKASEVREGKATLRTSLTDGKPTDYEIELGDIRLDARGSKCFSVHVTDETLLAATGGIVQGMSGSPIIQNGKLVGAVTHVMIANPTRGYGIFIENMLTQMGGLAG